jgi:hypothetical protein
MKIIKGCEVSRPFVFSALTLCLRGGFVGIRSLFSYGLSPCAFGTRSRKVYVHSFSSEKERTKKADQRLPPLETAPPAVLRQTAGSFVWQNSSICGAYIAPRRWVCCWQGLLLPRFRLKFLRTAVRSGWQKLFTSLCACTFRVVAWTSKQQRKS